MTALSSVTDDMTRQSSVSTTFSITQQGHEKKGHEKKVADLITKINEHIEQYKKDRAALSSRFTFTLFGHSFSPYDKSITDQKLQMADNFKGEIKGLKRRRDLVRVIENYFDNNLTLQQDNKKSDFGRFGETLFSCYIELRKTGSKSEWFEDYITARERAGHSPLR